jgi:hypothetical protein
MMIITTAGAVTINSPGSNADVAPVCSGDELELTCNIPGRVLEWNISQLIPQEYLTFKLVLDSVEPSFPVHTTMVYNISFTFSRISPPGNSHPLISRLLISPATSDVDGAIVACADRETRTNSSVTVNVIHNRSILTDNVIQGTSLISVLIVLLNWYKPLYWLWY